MKINTVLPFVIDLLLHTLHETVVDYLQFNFNNRTCRLVGWLVVGIKDDCLTRDLSL